MCRHYIYTHLILLQCLASLSFVLTTFKVFFWQHFCTLKNTVNAVNTFIPQ